MIRTPSANSGDIRAADSITGLGRYPGEGYDNPLQAGGLQHLGSQRVGHDWSDLTGIHGSSLLLLLWIIFQVDCLSPPHLAFLLEFFVSFIWTLFFFCLILLHFLQLQILFHRLQCCSSCLCCLLIGGWAPLRDLARLPNGKLVGSCPLVGRTYLSFGESCIRTCVY